VKDLIEIENIGFSYSNSMSRALSDVSLRIQKGEAVLLCGESGCGKTTITRLINGLIPHYYDGELTGSVRVGGIDVAKAELFETARFVGSVFQNPRSQFFCVDTTSEISFGCENMGFPEDEIRQRIAEATEDLDVTALLGRSIFKLSGGEKQRIACASVSAMRPEVLVLDEPTSNLDMAAIEKLREVLLLWKKQGKTIIIAEHRLHWLTDICDRVVYMRGGKVEMDCRMGDFVLLGARRLREMGLRPLYLGSLAPRNGHRRRRRGQLLLSDFSFRYEQAKNPALDIDTLALPENGIIAVIGNNGAGKSTFARCLCGLERRCRGVLKGAGKAQKTKQRLKRCYMVMQDVNHQLFTESVLDEVLLSMQEPDEVMAEKILASLDLLPVKDLHPMSLSGGQKQRVAIASAVASGRDIVIFDEPTSGLDLRHMKEVSENLWRLCGQERCLFIVTHDLELIMECCTHILHIENGRVIGNYPLDFEGSEKLKSFFGFTAVNRGNAPESPFENRLRNSDSFKTYEHPKEIENKRIYQNMVD
jgi:energy-coupling factor transporter ATP-binding protein EcfA2